MSSSSAGLYGWLHYVGHCGGDTIIVVSGLSVGRVLANSWDVRAGGSKVEDIISRIGFVVNNSWEVEIYQ